MSTLPEMLADIAKVFQDGPSWPFRTVSARRAWEAASEVLEGDPNAPLYVALRDGMDKARINSVEFTPEDYSVLSMAMRWKARQLLMAGRRTKTAFGDFTQPVLPRPVEVKR